MLGSVFIFNIASGNILLNINIKKLWQIQYWTKWSTNSWLKS